MKVSAVFSYEEIPPNHLYDKALCGHDLLTLASSYFVLTKIYMAGKGRQVYNKSL